MGDVCDLGTKTEPHACGANRGSEPEQLVVEDSGQDAVEGLGVPLVRGLEDRLP